MYYIDTPTQEVVAFDFNLVTGDITHKRTAIRIPVDQGSPDGMTIDAGHGVLKSRHNHTPGLPAVLLLVRTRKPQALAYGFIEHHAQPRPASLLACEPLKVLGSCSSVVSITGADEDGVVDLARYQSNPRLYSPPREPKPMLQRGPKVPARHS